MSVRRTIQLALCFGVRLSCAALVACSAVVAPENVAGVRCEVGAGDDPCAVKGYGWHCGQSGMCEPCESMEERCDGIDNDCDLRIDEGLEGVGEICDGLDNDCDVSIDEGLEGVSEICDGLDNDCDDTIDEGHDFDGDGVTWCGEGTRMQRDCDDVDPGVYPKLPQETVEDLAKREICDGKDNDCDLLTDERDDCVPANCAESGCDGDLLCDPVANRCLAVKSPGSPCTIDAQCGSGFCLQTERLGLRPAATGRMCATACCSDRDCPEEGACVLHPDGIRACLPTRISDRHRAGTDCEEPADCASRACGPISKTCMALCRAPDDCEPDDVCSYGGGVPLGAAEGWLCGVAVGRGDNHAACGLLGGDTCASGYCVQSGTSCGAPCGLDGDCPDGQRCDFRYAPPRGFGRESAYLSVCMNEDDVDPVRPPVCCTSGDCGDGQRCAPTGSGGAGMRCQIGLM